MPYIVTGGWAVIVVGLLMYANKGNSVSIDKARALAVAFILVGAIGVGVMQIIEGQIVEGEQDIIGLFSNFILAFSAALGGAFASHGFVPKQVSSQTSSSSQ